MYKKFKSDIENNLNRFEEIMETFYSNLYLEYKNNSVKAANQFLNSLDVLRGTYLMRFDRKYNKRKKEQPKPDEKIMHIGSFGGILLEWTIYYLIDASIKTENKSDSIQVINGYPIPFKKGEKNRKESTNIDIAVKKKSSSKLLYCIEVKTNFEDGFEKYFKEQQTIYHHRTKIIKNFKYHYFSITLRPKKFFSDSALKKKTYLLEKRNELWEFPILNGEKLNSGELVDKAKKFLDFVYKPIIEFKE
jgi:hypothetical protein